MHVVYAAIEGVDSSERVVVGMVPPVTVDICGVLPACLAHPTRPACPYPPQAKLWNTNHRPEHIMGDLEQTFKDLKVDYLDSWVIHWPMAVPSSGKFCATRVAGLGACTGPWKENPVSHCAACLFLHERI